MEQSGLGTAS
ncbi:hypothetical protein A2U01_0090556, partial [Trifolium medium]|nr:hypothetical protein [Trifolium medium]